MNGRYRMGAFALALGIALAGAISDARSQIIDMSKYPNIAGGWGRSEVFQWSRGEKPPLTPEYQAVYEANVAARRNGGHGTDVMYRCFPPGMPRQMHVYSPMEIVITPNVTYLLIDHIHDDRRIYTDGRTWPDEELEPLYSGHSIGKWVDEDGDGKYDVLEVETRFLKLPRSYDTSGIPFHSDGEAVIKERIYLDKADRNTLWNEITVLDHALTRPYVKKQKATRNPNPRPVWHSDTCSENNPHVRIGNEPYYVSADGKLMPSKKGQAPPDLSYFKQTGK